MVTVSVRVYVDFILQKYCLLGILCIPYLYSTFHNTILYTYPANDCGCPKNYYSQLVTLTIAMNLIITLSQILILTIILNPNSKSNHPKLRVSVQKLTRVSSP